MKRIFYPLTLVLILLALCSQISIAQPYTIFGGIPPADANGANGGNGIEVGTKFYVTQGGQVTEFLVYRGTDVGAGTYVAHLWDNAAPGVPLATETFTPTNANAWNTVTLTTPVTLLPGNTYVVSYYSPNGTYAYTPNYFNITPGTDVGADPIWGLNRNNTTTGNGVFADNPGPAGSFPITYFFDQGTAYLVDVTFALFFPLPVTLTDFKAIVNNKNVDLIWKTQTEENNKGFDIQRSNNNTDWYTIGYINGSGNSTGVHNYSYTDKQLAPGRYFYRLNQQDFDGHSKASSVVTASLTGKGLISLFQNTPNPVKSGLTSIRFDLPDEQKVRLSILDMTGREIKVLVDNKSQQGSHLVTLDATGLSRQLYIIRLQTETEIITKKMLIE